MTEWFGSAHQPRWTGKLAERQIRALAILAYGVKSRHTHKIIPNFKIKCIIQMSTASKLKYTYWMEGDFWLGYLEDYPDYQTQGSSLEELKDNLTDLYKDLSQGMIPSVRRTGELEVK
jgi:hypothetical protein